MRPITIIGGGLAGLSLGIGLRRAGVPVTVLEADHYPRHRVCGEFISGLSVQTIDKLGLGTAFQEAVILSGMRWYSTDRILREDVLPFEAKGISRWTLDQGLCECLTKLGGELQAGTRAQRRELGPGQVDCAGRQAEPDSRWLGLKCHMGEFELEADLEMHMSAHGYVGLSRIEGGRVNMCGLFRNAGLKPEGGEPFIFHYLRHCGFGKLLARLQQAAPVEGSECSVAALSYKSSATGDDGFRLGDARGLIPPFTGNGMSMAFESAALAVDPLRAYSNNEQTWNAARDQFAELAGARFDRRLAVARLVHGWLVSPQLFPLTAFAARTPLFPFRSLFRLTR